MVYVCGEQTCEKLTVCATTVQKKLNPVKLNY